MSFAKFWLRFLKACEKTNKTTFLFRGSAVGAFRSHGFIPWDEDIDPVLLVDNLDQRAVDEDVAEVTKQMGAKFYGKGTSIGSFAICNKQNLCLDVWTAKINSNMLWLKKYETYMYPMPRNMFPLVW